MDKPCRKLSGDKEQECKPSSRQEGRIKFNLAKDYLQCFISSKTQLQSSKDHPATKPLPSENSKHKPIKVQAPKILQLIANPPGRKLRVSFDHSHHLFNNKLLMMQYGQDQLYIDSTKTKNRLSSDTNSPKNGPEEGEDEFVASCVRVITEQTDNTSNPVSARYSIPEGYQYYSYESYEQPQRERARNRRSVSTEQSTMFQIDLNNIEKDGRTTLMLRNIPNKYTRDMILQEIDSWNFKKKYDFFYLPIDYRNECNVGYAFINFIHTKFISEFFNKFHHKKWQKFNSEKICQVCYARIQGTAQLVNHFKDSTVIHQKNKKLGPIIDMNYSSLAEMIQRQKNETGRVDFANQGQ